MHRFPRAHASRLFAALLCAGLCLSASAQISVRSVRVLGSRDNVEIEVEASDHIVPQTQVLTGPDRLVVDFPNALPGAQVRNQSVDRGEVKDVRVGLFQSQPPVTRVVLDLKSARSYQIFPYGRTVMIKIIGGGEGSIVATRSEDYASQPQSHAGLVAANYSASAEPVRIAAPLPPLQVSYRDGLLGIRANKATLSEVLYAVQQRTGADIAIAAGAEQERVVADIEPAPAPEVLARLLNGSRFNFLILSAPNDPRQLDRVILSRMEGSYQPPPVPIANANPEPDPSPEDNAPNVSAVPIEPDTRPERQMPPEEEEPQKK